MSPCLYNTITYNDALFGIISFIIVNYCINYCINFFSLFYNRAALCESIDIVQCIVCKNEIKSFEMMECRHSFCPQCFKNRLKISHQKGINILKMTDVLNINIQ